ncbi:hypothetical protein WJX72_005353 [[Myrmecia] bisecta]|uniref:Uncharacterized protein n=1 Tax=[Myrmecia] bisecta TaxID=41462 RepID=A0AAW1Q7X0_9CHLO
MLFRAAFSKYGVTRRLTFAVRLPDQLHAHAVRHASSQAFGSALHVDPDQQATSAVGSLVPDLNAAAAAAQVDAALGSSLEPGGSVGLMIGAIDSMHAATQLPWWAAISLAALGVRTVMFPLTLRQLQTSSAILPLLREPTDASGPGTARTDGSGDSSRHPPRTGGARIKGLWGEFQHLRRERGAPHPAWIVVAPLVQLPVFITAMISIRTMTLSHWPGMDAGGLLWFSDLTKPALDLHLLAAPLGSVGVVIPAAVAAVMFANVDVSFGRAALGPPGSVGAWLAGNMRLLLEWLTVPMFVVALQLPHGALLYWLTSGLTSLAQSAALRTAAAHAALGLPGGAPATTGQASAATEGDSSSAAASTAEHEKEDDLVHEELSDWVASSSEVEALFSKAVELHAGGRRRASAQCIERILELQPDNVAALFKRCQLWAAAEAWPQAEQAGRRAAELATDPKLALPAWLLAGNAQFQQGELELALGSFRRGIDIGREDALQKKQVQPHFIHALLCAANVLTKAGRQKEAVLYVNEAAKHDPNVKAQFLTKTKRGN